MTKWVHAVEEIYQFQIDRKLDEWGDKGWELVALTLLPTPGADPETLDHLFLAMFKQPSL